MGVFYLNKPGIDALDLFSSLLNCQFNLITNSSIHVPPAASWAICGCYQVSAVYCLLGVFYVNRVTNTNQGLMLWIFSSIHVPLGIQIHALDFSIHILWLPIQLTRGVPIHFEYQFMWPLGIRTHTFYLSIHITSITNSADPGSTISAAPGRFYFGVWNISTQQWNCFWLVVELGNVLFICFQISNWNCGMFNIIRLDILYDCDCPFLFSNGCVFVDWLGS